MYTLIIRGPTNTHDPRIEFDVIVSIYEPCKEVARKKALCLFLTLQRLVMKIKIPECFS